jgi:hypothetical protein
MHLRFNSKIIIIRRLRLATSTNDIYSCFIIRKKYNIFYLFSVCDMRSKCGMPVCNKTGYFLRAPYGVLCVQ